VTLAFPLDVLHHQHDNGEAVEHQDKQDVEVGMAVVLLLLRMRKNHFKIANIRRIVKGTFNMDIFLKAILCTRAATFQIKTFPKT
jgi:hypothetical protein